MTNALDTFGNRPIKPRHAWQLLQANYSEKTNITRERWELLARVFEYVDDDLLNRAVVAHMRESIWFPTVHDIQEKLDNLTINENEPVEFFVWLETLPICAGICGEHTWSLTPDTCPFCADLGIMLDAYEHEDDDITHQWLVAKR